MNSEKDYDLPFSERYLNCARALGDAAHWLAVVGLGGSRVFAELQAQFINHGAQTHADINRDKTV